MQQDATPAGNGQHADTAEPARAARRRPRTVSAARRLVLDERFEQKRLKRKLLTVLPMVRQWAARVAAPADAGGGDEEMVPAALTGSKRSAVEVSASAEALTRPAPPGLFAGLRASAAALVPGVRAKGLTYARLAGAPRDERASAPSRSRSPSEADVSDLAGGSDG